MPKMAGSTDDLIKAIAAFTSSCMMEAVRRRKQEVGLRNHSESKHSSPSLPDAFLFISLTPAPVFLPHPWLHSSYCPDSLSSSQVPEILNISDIINPQGLRAPVQSSTQYSTETVRRTNATSCMSFSQSTLPIHVPFHTHLPTPIM